MTNTPHIDRLTGDMPDFDRLMLRHDGFTIIDEEGRGYAHAARVGEDTWVIGTGALTSSAFGPNNNGDDRFRITFHSSNVDEVQEAAEQIAVNVIRYHRALDEADDMLSEEIKAVPDRIQGAHARAYLRQEVKEYLPPSPGFAENENLGLREHREAQDETQDFNSQ